MRLNPDRLRAAMAAWENPETGAPGMSVTTLAALLYLKGYTPGITPKEVIIAWLSGGLGTYNKSLLGLAGVLDVSVAWLCGKGEE